MEKDNTLPIAVMLWGELYTDARDVYRNAPNEPRISEQGFKGRIRKRFKLVGYLTPDFIEHALFTGTLGYEGGGGIYVARQKSTGLLYYGISQCPEERIESHLLYYSRRKYRLHVAMADAGPDDFTFEIIFQGDILRANLRMIERALILSAGSLWPNGFNER